MTFLRFVMFTFWNYYILKTLRLETIIFGDATLSDVNVVLFYILSQYPKKKWKKKITKSERCICPSV